MRETIGPWRFSAHPVRRFLFDPRDGTLISKISSQPRGVGSGAFDEEGDRFVIGFVDGSFRWYASDDGRALSSYYDCTPRAQVWVPKLRSLTPAGSDESIVFAVTPDYFARSWSDDGELHWELPLISAPYDLAISPNRDFAITGSATGELNFIDLTMRTKRVLEGHTAHIYRIAYSPDGSQFACASFDHQISLWKSDGTLLRMMKHDDKCKQVAFSPDGSVLASVSFDGTARLWEVSSGRELHRLPHSAAVLTLAFSSDGRLLATGGRDDAVTFWDVESGKQHGEPYHCHGAVEELLFFTGDSGERRLLVKTWKPALLVLPAP